MNKKPEAGEWAIGVKRAFGDLAPSERGAVIFVPAFHQAPPPHWPANFGRVLAVQQQIDPQQLRHALLFWDRLDFPQSSAVYGEQPEVAYLKSAGVLSRSHVVSRGPVPRDAEILWTQAATFRSLDKADPGKWTMLRGANSLDLPEDAVAPDKAVLLELYRCIPVPTEDVALEDILDFKRRRQAELVALRTELESLYQSIIAAPDQEQALATAITRVDRAIAEQIRVFAEAPWTFRFSSPEIKIDRGTLAGVAGGLYFAPELGLPLASEVISAIGGGLLASFSMRASAGWKAARQSKSPFEYVARYHSEVFRGS